MRNLIFQCSFVAAYIQGSIRCVKGFAGPNDRKQFIKTVALSVSLHLPDARQMHRKKRQSAGTDIFKCARKEGSKRLAFFSTRRGV
jgi:hypothetical protein